MTGEGRWTEKQLTKMREMVANKDERFTAQQIGDRIGKPRSAVIGKCRRLALTLPNQHGTNGTGAPPSPSGVVPKAQPRRKGAFNFVRMPKKPEEDNGQHGPLSINFDHGQTGSKAGAIPKETVEVKAPISWVTRPANTCGWIVGEPKALVCCGALTEKRYYCPAHDSAAYSKGHHENRLA